jgi:2-amino-4-hydroxy-6-hydroxymethyldihydropteridine diphosphokinase
MQAINQVFLSLGTNLGRRRANLRSAITGLEREIDVTAVSSLYETKPWGLGEQPSFLNLCVAANCEHSPDQLLTFIKTLEVELGRQPTVRWGPRLIDIDILLFDDLVMQNERLTIPHRHMSERAFVLVPLADIAPEKVHPQSGLSVAQMVAGLDPSMIQGLSEPMVLEKTGD